jgi:hypothetical protein
MPIDNISVQSKLLYLINGENVHKSLGGGVNYLAKALNSEFTQGNKPERYQFMEAVWSLIGQGLAYIDFSQDAPTNWTLEITEAGRIAIEGEEANPDDAGNYMVRLKEMIPEISETVSFYTMESLKCYNNRCNTACAVILGVASEAAFLEAANSFCSFLTGNEGEKFRQIISAKKTHYYHKYNEFKKRIESHKNRLPGELKDNLTINFDCILNLLRIYRNESGHPSGRKISRVDAKANLQILPVYLERLYKLKTFFDENKSE